MPKHLFEASYSAEGVRGVAEKGGTARRDAIEQLFQAAGGKLESFYFAFGHTDAYVFGEAERRGGDRACAQREQGWGRDSQDGRAALA